MPLSRSAAAHGHSSNRAHQSAPGHERDRLALGALGVFIVLSWLVWVAGGLLALVTTGHWREVSATQAPAVLVRLMCHPDAARDAWPASMRGDLPGPLATQLWLGALLVSGMVFVGMLWHLGNKRFTEGTSNPASSRRPQWAHLALWAAGLGRMAVPKPGSQARGWARSGDLRPLRAAGAPGDRIVLGTLGGHLLAAEARHSVMVVGPTQSGKTTGLAIPAILEWAGPVLATSVKADLLRETIAWRRRLGQVQYYDPTGSIGDLDGVSRSSSWSPLAGACSWPGARRVASALCSVARSGDTGMEDAGFWYANAEKLIAPLLFAASSAGASITEVVRWLDEEETAEVLLALEIAGVPEALRAARVSFGREERQRASVYATAETVLAAFADPEVAKSAATCEIDPGALVSGHAGSLFCCAPARDQERLAPVFTAIVRQVLDAAFEAAASTGCPLDPPLLVVLDEAASVAPLSDLDRVVATGASHGIQLVTVWQDLAQLEARYGPRWATVVNNHRAKLVCSGIADPVTLSHMSGLLGEQERAERSWTVGDDGRSTRTEAFSVQALAPPGWLRQLPAGEAVLVYGRFPPARINLRPYFDDPILAARAGSSGAPTAAYEGSDRGRRGTRRARLTAWSPRRS